MPSKISNRIIAHLDMDAFFASVEERDCPRLKGKPIVVGSDPKEGKGRGVVSTANYKAREYGIRSALPISIAWKYSQQAKAKGLPEAVFVSPDFSRYSVTSDRILNIIKKYSKTIEPASIDEAYFDLSYCGSYKKAEEICKKIKSEIKKKEKLTASIGLGPNKLISKIASDMQKPDGLTVILPEKVETFLEPLTIRKIPGIGPKTEEVFKKLNIALVKDLKKYPKSELEKLLGKWGSELYEKIRGIDNSPLVEEWEAKSIGEQETLELDTSETEILLSLLKKLSSQVYKRFEKSDFNSFQTVGITVRFSNFVTKTRVHTLEISIDKNARAKNILEFESIKLFLPFTDSRENPKHYKIRLLGVKVEKLLK